MNADNEMIRKDIRSGCATHQSGGLSRETGNAPQR
jgi:hypothetical protein